MLLAAVLTLGTTSGMIWLAGLIYANSVRRVGVGVKLADAVRGG